MTALLAMLVTAGFGYLAETQYDPRAALAAELESADQAVREQMLERGWEPIAQPPSSPLERAQIEVLRAQRNFTLPLSSGTVTGQPPKHSAIEPALQVIAHELAKLSPQFLRKSRLRRVLLTGALKLDETSIPSLPNYERTLLIDPDVPSDFLRHLLYHELFHFLDYADDDSLSVDPEWQELNDRYFVYGSGGRYLREPGAAEFRRDLPGFVSRYATSALEEDKAEVFAFAFITPAALLELAARDVRVSAKLAAVRRQVAQFHGPTAELMPRPSTR